MDVLTDNLITALRLAIEAQEAEERRAGFTGESSLLAGWKELLKKVRTREVTTLYLTT